MIFNGFERNLIRDFFQNHLKNRNIYALYCRKTNLNDPDELILSSISKLFELSLIQENQWRSIGFNAEFQQKDHIGKQTTALRWISLSFFPSWLDKILVLVSVMQSAFLTHNSRVPGNGLTDRGFQSQLVCFCPVGLMGNTGSGIRDRNLQCALY